MKQNGDDVILLSALIADLRLKGNFNDRAKTLLCINSTPKALEHFLKDNN